MAQDASSGENRDFAFGHNTVGSCDCPAVKVGKDPITNDRVLVVSEMYDDELRKETDSATGTISESRAKEAWLNVIEWYDEQEGLLPKHREEREEARKIAAELGWLDDE